MPRQVLMETLVVVMEMRMVSPEIDGASGKGFVAMGLWEAFFPDLS